MGWDGMGWRGFYQTAESLWGNLNRTVGKNLSLEKYIRSCECKQRHADLAWCKQGLTDREEMWKKCLGQRKECGKQPEEIKKRQRFKRTQKG